MKFHTTVMLGGKRATGLVIPEAVIERLGAGKRPKVSVTLNDYTYRTTVAPRNGQYLLSLSAENREAAGLAAGDEIDVEIVVDDAPREVEVPADLTAALGDGPAREFFDSLAYTHRKGWVRWISEAKKEETRLARIEKAVAALKTGERVH
jgi:hypothetical protein